jgi:hypothetical protein
MSPCIDCPKDTYQTEYGRTICIACGGGLKTSGQGSKSFKECSARGMFIAKLNVSHAFWYVSFGQSIHGDIPVLENLPGGHKTERQVQKYVVPHKDDCQIK